MMHLFSSGIRTVWDILVTVAIGAHIIGALRHLTNRTRLTLHLAGFSLASALAKLTFDAEPTLWWWTLLLISLAPVVWLMVRRHRRHRAPEERRNRM